MVSLLTHLASLRDALNELRSVLLAEQVQLCAGQVDGVALQMLTEQKQTLLVAVQYLEQHRQMLEVHDESFAPYPPGSELAICWQQIQRESSELGAINQHNGLLLQKHQQRNHAQLTQLHQQQGQTLYGPDGQSARRALLGRKVGI